MKSGRFLFAFLLIPLLAVVGCSGDDGAAGPAGPQGPAGPAGTVSCVQCHNDTNIIVGKHLQWEESGHGMGEAYVRGTSASCAGCHSGNAFRMMIEAGLMPNEVAEGDPAPTRQDCRACHQIHSGDSYDSSDWALQSTEPVAMYAIAGTTYNGGNGNLCVNCHQPRRDFPAAVGGMITGITSHWGPHHGPQSAMLMGLAGAGVTGSAAGHYLVGDTCVHCHVGEDMDHTFEPSVSACQACHPGATDFDIGDTQTEVEALVIELGDLLVGAGLINENTEDGHPTVTEAPEAEATALWNWIYVAHEDKSMGVHNPTYAKALLQKGIDLMNALPAR